MVASPPGAVNYYIPEVVHPLLPTHAAATWALVGLIWTVQLALYPLFSSAGRGGAFHTYHARHGRNITWVVAPLMALELVSGIVIYYSGSDDAWLRLAAPLLLFNWFSTFFIQVPLHNRLSKGFDTAVHRRLVLTNWLRTAAWTARGFLILVSMSGLEPPY